MMAKERKEKELKTKLRERLSPPLPRLEIVFYFAALIFASAYSIYNVYLCSKAYADRIQERELVKFGSQKWQKDVSDAEFHDYERMLKYYLFYLMVHFAGTNWVKRTKKEYYLPHTMSLIGAAFLISVSGSLGLIYCLLQPLTFYLVMMTTRSTKMVYLISLLWLYGEQTLMVPQEKLYDYMAYSYSKEWSLGMVLMASNWINLRCLSYCLDNLWSEVPKPESHKKRMLGLLSYCLYTPLLFFGPIVNFKEHHYGLTSSNVVPLTFVGLRPLVSSFLRHLLWLMVARASLYFLYFEGLSHLPDVLNIIDAWTLAGIGYLLAQFFNLKYIIFYGVPRVFLSSDGIKAPLPTKCISRIAIYSDMWRYFDNGLYLFLKKYYFSPILSVMDWNNCIVRLIAAVFTFLFIFLWHGVEFNVFLWSISNFVGITIEAAARWIGSSTRYQNLEARISSSQWRRRLLGLAATPLCMMSVISQFFFFLDTETAKVHGGRFLTSFPENAVLFFFMYCGHQVSVEMKNKDILKQMREMEKKIK